MIKCPNIVKVSFEDLLVDSPSSTENKSEVERVSSNVLNKSKFNLKCYDQIVNIQRLVANHNNSKMYNNCTSLFVIEAKWMKAWHSYCISENSSAHPGAINNRPIVLHTDTVIEPNKKDLEMSSEALCTKDYDKTTSNNSYEDCRLRLKDENHIQIDIDYYLLPREAWDTLRGWYGGGPPIVRFTFNASRFFGNIPCYLGGLLEESESDNRLNDNEDVIAISESSDSKQILNETIECNATSESKTSSSSSPPSSLLRSLLLRDLYPVAEPPCVRDLVVLLSQHQKDVLHTVVTTVPASVSTSTATVKFFYNLCYVCKEVSTMRCSKCSCIYYCGRDCQSVHWKYHRIMCAKFIKEKQLGNHPTHHGQHVEAKRDANATVLAHTMDAVDAASGTILKGPGMAKQLANLVHDRRGKVGLMNLGNSCYMNSSLQCLSHIKPLTLALLNPKTLTQCINKTNRDGTGGLLAENYAALLRDLWFEPIRRSVSPLQLKTTLGKIHSEYAGLAQQDAHELIELLLDKLHEDVNRVHSKPYTTKIEGDGSNDAAVSAASWSSQGKREDSMIRDQMGSLMRSQLTCPSCGKVSVSYEYHNTLQVSETE